MLADNKIASRTGWGGPRGEGPGQERGPGRAEGGEGGPPGGPRGAAWNAGAGSICGKNASARAPPAPHRHPPPGRPPWRVLPDGAGEATHRAGVCGAHPLGARLGTAPVCSLRGPRPPHPPRQVHRLPGSQASGRRRSGGGPSPSTAIHGHGAGACGALAAPQGAWHGGRLPPPQGPAPRPLPAPRAPRPSARSQLSGSFSPATGSGCGHLSLGPAQPALHPRLRSSSGRPRPPALSRAQTPVWTLELARGSPA